ncbi:MAG: hypothetical protein KDB27_07770 [Planctomycetales bacterium]|nr:hypothetical protein [Planctomycetales bacterium]
MRRFRFTLFAAVCLFVPEPTLCDIFNIVSRESTLRYTTFDQSLSDVIEGNEGQTTIAEDTFGGLEPYSNALAGNAVSQTSEILANGVTVTLSAVARSASTEFGTRTASSEFRLRFTADESFQYSLMGTIREDSIGFPFTSYVSEASASLSNPATIVLQATTQAAADSDGLRETQLNSVDVLGPGEYELFLQVAANSSSIEDGAASLDIQFLVEPTAIELVGDFDGDGALAANDIDILLQAVHAGNFVQALDLNGDGALDNTDRDAWLDEANSHLGDANLDGTFNSSDLVAVFTAGQYRDAIEDNSTWATGDWTGDRDFDTDDFIAAFKAGDYDRSPAAARATESVPEPCVPSVLIVLGLALARKPTLSRQHKRSP